MSERYYLLVTDLQVPEEVDIFNLDADSKGEAIKKAVVEDEKGNVPQVFKVITEGQRNDEFEIDWRSGKETFDNTYYTEAE